MSTRMRACFGSALCGLLLYAASSAVSPVAATPDSCPNIMISDAQDKVAGDRKYLLTVNISGGDPSRNPTFKWCISHGKITDGRNTSAVVIDAAGVTEEIITVTVIVNDLGPPACDNVGVYQIKLTQAPAPDSAPPGAR